MTTPLRGMIFDKDGTLVDFHATWDPATGAGLRASTPDQATLQAAADAIGYDLETDTIRSDSIFIAETNDVIFAALEPHLPLIEFGDVVGIDQRGTCGIAEDFAVDAQFALSDDCLGGCNFA